MSDIKLFRIQNNRTSEITGAASNLERDLQSLIEANLESLLGIRFLATEYSTGKTHAGRIDTLGLDENNSPVIFEYKRSLGENVINQGLFYLDWLMDHKAEFQLLVLDKFGKSTADNIDWSAPRLVCIAADFTKYDSHAVQQINRNIELIRYRKFGEDLLLFELANAVTADASQKGKPETKKAESTAGKNKPTDKTVEEWLADLQPPLLEVFQALETFMYSLGDDVQRKDLKLYIAFKRLRNFATVCFQKSRIQLYLHVNPDEIAKPYPEIFKDVRQTGHWGTGDLEVTLQTFDHLEKAKPLIQTAYDGRTA